MTVRPHAPLTVLYMAPPDLAGTASSGLIGGHGMMPDVLRVEVAACIAAVGHRMRVVQRSPGSDGATTAATTDATTDGQRPALVLWGLAPGETGGPEGEAVGLDATIVPVALDGGAARPGVLRLPSDARRLCRLLALTAPADTGRPVLPGRAAVVFHDGSGLDGDDDWPGLSWALTLLLAGPGRGLLMDLRGPGGSLSERLRTLAPPPEERCVGWHSLPEVPVPGPALAARLPGAAGVRWWGWAAAPAGAGPAVGAIHGGWPGPEARLEACLEVAGDTLPWTVLDVGRNREAAEELAGRGNPLIVCLGPASDPRGPGRTLVRRTVGSRPPDARPAPVLVLNAAGPRGGVRLGGNRRTERPPRPEAPGLPGSCGVIAFEAADWAGASLASWVRSTRRRPARSLAAEVALRLAVPRDSAARRETVGSMDGDGPGDRQDRATATGRRRR